jgi:hypothetical protein
MRSIIVDPLGNSSPIEIRVSFFTIASSFGLIAANFMHRSFQLSSVQYLEAAILTRRMGATRRMIVN